MDINKVTLIGNLVHDPVRGSAPAGKQPLVTFELATNYYWRESATKQRREAVEVHAVVAFGRLAEIVAEYVKRGSKVYVEGRLRSRSWKDKRGNTQRTAEIVADNLIMLGHRAKREETQDEQE